MPEQGFSRRDLIRRTTSAVLAAGISEPVKAGQGTASFSSVRALIFDVFGTVVDWRSSVIAEGEQLGKAKLLRVDWAKFADAWRAGYAPSMNRVRTGELPWTKLDDLHRTILDRLLVEFGISGLTDSEKDHLNRAWHRLKPWPDAVAGLTRLKQRFIIAPCSNGNVALMTNLAKHAGLPWDVILGAELAKHYKPDPEVYRTAASLLDLRPADVMMIAAHLGDLRAAHALGFRTGFVARPLEYGPAGKPDLKAEPWVDVSAADFNDLARKLA
jgi:2-haloacid dehalogenase